MSLPTLIFCLFCLVGSSAEELADRAADLYFRELAVEACGLTSLFGVPTDAQRQRASRAARAMHDLAAQAALAIDEAILALEASPDYANDVTARAERRRLAEQERDRRIPFLRGVGAVLHAELNVEDPEEVRVLARVAAPRLESLVERLEGGLAGQARVYAALARMQLGEHEAALALVRPMLEDADGLAARLVATRAQAHLAGPEAALGALEGVKPRDALAAFLLADQRFLLRRRLDLMAEACAAYLDLLEGDLGLEPAVQRALVMARLRAAVPAEAPLASLPPIVTVARAQELAARAPGRAEAVALLEGLLERRGLEGRVRAEVLLLLGRTLLAEGRLEAAADRLGQLVGDHPGAGQAPLAADLAAQTTAALHASWPADDRTKAQHRAAMDRLLEGYGDLPSADRWRVEAGDLALVDGRFADALAHYDDVDAAGDWGPTAAAGKALLVRINAMDDAAGISEHLAALLEAAGDDAGPILEGMVAVRRRRIEQLEAQGRDAEAGEVARRSLLPVGEALDRWLASRGSERSEAALRVAAADAFRLAGRCDRARPLYESLLEQHPALLSALLGKAECLVNERRDFAEAMSIYRRISETLNERAGAPYWLAQLRMLQILEHTGRHLERIAPHIRRLREKDPSLGGDRFRHAFDALERKHS